MDSIVTVGRADLIRDLIAAGASRSACFIHEVQACISGYMVLAPARVTRVTIENLSAAPQNNIGTPTLTQQDEHPVVAWCPQDDLRAEVG
jgi:hypothetical protein